MANYIFELYKEDEQMTKALTKMFEKFPIVCFAKLTGKSAIATLNSTQSVFVDDGYRFYEFIQEGILNTLEINRTINFNWLFTMKINGKADYFFAGEKFRETVLNRFGR